MSVRNIERRRIIFSAIGTAGDALPLIAVGREMVRRGYECHLLGNEPFAARAQAAGVQFTPVARQQENNLAPFEYSLENFHFASFSPTRAFFSRLDLSVPTLIANVSNISATSVLAELHGIPICRLHFAPFHILSLAAPPSPLKERAQGPLGQTFLKYALPKIYEHWDSFPFSMKCLNSYRTEWGLPAVRFAKHAEQFIFKYIGLFPDWFAPRASDWSERLVTTGFPLEPASGSLPHEVEEFLSGRERPLVFTPGTGVTDIAVFFREAALCCQTLQKPGIFLSRSLQRDVNFGEHILALPYVDLESLLPRAALVVHHGGVGTTARALEAAVPQVISPVAFDQFDNAARIVTLGAGATLKRSELSGAALAALTTNLTQSDQVRASLRSIQARLRQSEAIRDTADELEATFVSAHARAGAARTA